MSLLTRDLFTLVHFAAQALPSLPLYQRDDKQSTPLQVNSLAELEQHFID